MNELIEHHRRCMEYYLNVCKGMFKGRKVMKDSRGYYTESWLRFYLKHSDRYKQHKRFLKLLESKV